MQNQSIKAHVLFQLDMCWQLYGYHTETLEDREAYWAFRPSCLQVRRQEGGWRIDWPEEESYRMGPPSIAWMMWHMMYWWTMALDHNFGEGTKTKEDISWPGSVDAAKAAIRSLHDQWAARLSEMTDEDFHSAGNAKWPFEGRSFADIALWLNGELMKNAAEIGQGRFLYATASAV